MLRETQVENGKVKGLPGNDPRITVYKGIPFAAPPVGENRWKAPQPCPDWEGTLQAYEFGPISMQDTPGVGDGLYDREWHVDPDIKNSEDCLYLNIWTPAKKAQEKLPVLVWIYGGAFQWGYTAEMEFNGEALAKRGIVVVSIAYRLGCFGFMAHPEITKESPDAPSNFGLLDQRAGLLWVKRNIAAFGGDPDNIAIGGQSAGGASVQHQLCLPENRDIIKRAAIFSGFIKLNNSDADIFNPLGLTEAEDLGKEFFDCLGVNNLSKARQLSAKQLLEGYNRFVSSHRRMFPIVDNIFCCEDPTEKIMNGNSIDVPILSGNTTDEFSEAGVNMVELSTKEVFLKASKKHPDQNYFYYRFDPDIPGDGHKGDSYPGTFHSCDLWFFFNTLHLCHRPYQGRHFDLANQMCDYFANFIKTGNPNGNDNAGNPLPRWESYRVEALCEMEFLGSGATPRLEGGIRQGSRKQAVNPYLPSWEYIPDGEPYVFGDRVFIYGSHDLCKGETFCLGDYVCWSAPLDDLGNWHYEGVIYKKTQDPLNEDGHMCLYAPDVTVGPDGRYYLFYVLDKVCVVSVAVSDTPAGPFEFYGYVHYEDGTKLGEKEGDEPQFDPGVITEGDLTYLYTGFCGQGDSTRHGAMLTVLDRDMLTIKKAPKFVAPGNCYSKGTGFEGHAFFEAPSIRKRNNTYYFIYSSEVMHELCYATSHSPEGPFTYGGVIVSNCDLHIDSYKEADVPTAYGANNHGSIVEINSNWYIFYHRHTHGTWFSRQGCAEKITFNTDGSIRQAEITSCGLNGAPLKDIGEYPAYIACNIFTRDKKLYVEETVPRVVQEGGEDSLGYSYIKGIVDGTTIGFKYFNLNAVAGLRIKTRAYFNGEFEIRTGLGDATDNTALAGSDNSLIGIIKANGSNIWTAHECRFNAALTKENSPLYLVYRGTGNCSLKSIEFIH